MSTEDLQAGVSGGGSGGRSYLNIQPQKNN